MEGLHLFKDLLRSFAQVSSKNFSISMEGKYLRVLVSMFWSRSTTSDFYKIIKDSPLAVLRRIQIRTIIYLNKMLLMSQTINSLEIARNTLIFLLQSLGFLINLQKSVLVPLQKIKLLGLETNLVRMTLTLPQEKVKKLRLKFQRLICYKSGFYINSK